MDSHNLIIDIHNSVIISIFSHNASLDIHNWIMDKHDWIMDIHDWIINIHIRIMGMYDKAITYSWIVCLSTVGLFSSHLVALMFHFIGRFSFIFPTWWKFHIFRNWFSGHQNKFCALLDSICVICKHCSDRLIRTWISWSQHKSAPAKFESEENELLKWFRFWWNNR